MILIELEGGNAPRFRLEFHPRFTVVAGLTVQQRDILARSIKGAIAGGDVGLEVSVDVGGVPQLLSTELAQSINFFDVPFDNILDKSMLPGARIRNPASELDDAEAIHAAAAADSLAEAKARVEQLSDELSGIAHSLQSAQNELGAEDSAEVEAAQRAYEQLAGEFAEMEEQYSHRDDPVGLANRLEELQAYLVRVLERRDYIRAELEAPVPNVEEVVDALRDAAAAQQTQSEDNKPRQLRELAAAWRAVWQQIDALPEEHAPTWLVNQTRDDLEEAEARVKALRIQESEGISVGIPLLKALDAFEDAQAAWDELQGPGQGTRQALDSQREELYASACQLLGYNPDPFGLDAHLEEQANVRSQLHPEEQRLSEVLAAHGVNAVDAIGAAQDWLDQQRAVDDERISWRHDLDELQSSAADWSNEIAELQQRIAHSSDYERIDVDLTQLRAERDAALSHVDALRNAEAGNSGAARIQHLQDRFDELSAALRLAQSQLSQLEAELPALDGAQPSGPWWQNRASAATTSAPRPPTPPPTVGYRSVQVDLDDVPVEDIETFVLARAASLRRVGAGESVPLLINAAFDDLAPDDLIRLLTVLPRISPIVQIVYLASADLVAGWAKSQEEAVVAVCRLERA